MSTVPALTVDGPDLLGAGHTRALPCGVRVQEYQIQRVLGGGGFGLTYLARDAHLDLPVALKEFFPAEVARRRSDGVVAPWSDDAATQHAYRAGLDRFLDEARTLATFRHPHIVRVLRYFQANGTAYIVMEYEAGLPLNQWVPRHAPLTRDALLALVMPLLDGLEAVHAAGFLHRDVKPDNVLVRAAGSPVLLDFGAAGRVNASPGRAEIVSPGFASPEQYDDTASQGPWTDVYSMGAVMYWMATGCKPAEAPARRIADRMPPAAARAPAGMYGQALLSVIDEALQPDPRQRPQSIAELRAAIATAAPLRGPQQVPPGATPWPEALQDGLGPGLHRRKLLCSVLFMDLVGQSLRPVDEQVVLKAQLDELIACVVDVLPADNRLPIDTGDGAALCFLGDPQEALHAALRLGELLAPMRRSPALQVRAGLHIGPVRVVRDINHRFNVIGDGISVARHVMDFATANQVLATRAFRDVVTRQGDRPGDLFRYAGPHVDKHGRIHEVHVLADLACAAATGGAMSSDSRHVAAPWLRRLDEAATSATETELALDTGPKARALVSKARHPEWRGVYWLNCGSRPVPGSSPARFRLADDPARWRDNAPAWVGSELRPAPAGRPRS